MVVQNTWPLSASRAEKPRKISAHLHVKQTNFRRVVLLFEFMYNTYVLPYYFGILNQASSF